MFIIDLDEGERSGSAWWRPVLLAPGGVPRRLEHVLGVLQTGDLLKRLPGHGVTLADLEVSAAPAAVCA